MKNKKKLMRLVQPVLGEEEIRQIRQVIQSGFLTQGTKLDEFEKLVAKFIGTKYAFATTSATTALHLSLAALGIGSGDEVLVPDFTFPATANVVIQQGAKPVLVDIDLETFTIDISDLERKVTPHTKAIIPVHAFGLSADMDSILILAKKHKLYVVEDAACALGTIYYGKKCGSLGTTGCFSFHPRKAITTGEGGMITTNNYDLAQKIKILRNHGGIREKGRFRFVAAGYNYRMSDIAAAIGVAQMKKLNSIIIKRRNIATLLTEKLKKVKGVRLPTQPKWGGHVFQSYVVLLDKHLDRDKIIEWMFRKGIETTIGTYALHDQPFFNEFLGKNDSLSNSHKAYKQSLTLPLYPQMKEKDIQYIADSLKSVINTSFAYYI